MEVNKKWSSAPPLKRLFVLLVVVPSLLVAIVATWRMHIDHRKPKQSDVSSRIAVLAATSSGAKSHNVKMEQKGTMQPITAKAIQRQHTPAAPTLRNISAPCPDIKKPLLPLTSEQPKGCENSDTFYASPLFCHSSNKPIVVILILSYIGNFQIRHQARTVWLRSRFKMNSEFVKSHPWAYVFVVGKAHGKDAENLEKMAAIEQCHYKDILQVDVVENYYNLTWKKLEAWKYLIKSQLDFEVMLKGDDDSFINIQLVFEWLDEVIPKVYIRSKKSNSSLHVMYGGLCPLRGSPIRSKGSKWHLSVEHYAPKSFPPFCFGAGYFVSRDLIKALLKVSDLMYSFRLEDVHTGLLVAKTGLVPAADVMGTNRVCNADYQSCTKILCSQPYVLMTSNAARRAALFRNFMQAKC
ncbi:beta-1,3-galactosyltransferase 5-like isoform X1 [Corticium candelabrum]|uniref:beta-1,3-galactosyltransferase 5-like isoform X1 n=1 Tax=Corticium candelabrum TaxID=121492 RepID=UPI002E26F6DF|nr:beta-1,3-galactosyltransferase 5-like isoform X1 [Corticium candelabrum]